MFTPDTENHLLSLLWQNALWKKQYCALLPLIFRFKGKLSSHPFSSSFTFTQSRENLAKASEVVSYPRPPIKWDLHFSRPFDSTDIFTACVERKVGEEADRTDSGHGFWSEICDTCLISCIWRRCWFYFSWIAWYCVCEKYFVMRLLKCYFKNLVIVMVLLGRRHLNF